MPNKLTLPEALILLALNDDTGSRIGRNLNMAIAGAGLAELALRGIVRERGNPPSLLLLSQDLPTGDPYLDGCVEVINLKGLETPLKMLVQSIARQRGLQTRLLDRLVERGILEKRARKWFGIIPQTFYPEARSEPEKLLKRHLSSVMAGSEEVSARDAVIIALARQSGLLKANFDAPLLNAHCARIDEIAAGKMLVAGASAETISAMQAAILMTVIIPIVVMG